MVEAFELITPIYLVRPDGGIHIIAWTEVEQILKVVACCDEVLRVVCPFSTSVVSA